MSHLRQPVHTVYGGAHLFTHDVCRKFGSLAERALLNDAPDPATLALALAIPNRLAETVYDRVLRKLRREPVEDLHIDFEDGYGVRSNDEEDAAALRCAHEVALGMQAATLPESIGIRIKPLNPECRDRAIRTLNVFCSALLEKAGAFPPNFSVTLPKITSPDQVADFAELLDAFHLSRLELMIETPESVLEFSKLIAAARGQCVAAHFGPYDYTASLGISRQSIRHPICDWARSMLLTQAAATGIRLSDGPTNVMPVPIYRDSPTPHQTAENRASVHRAWKTHYDNIQHALLNGFFQGWDLHPAQLVSRFASVYTFFLEDLPEASARLRNFIAKAAQATMVGAIFDDAATGQGLLNYFRRASDCGAIPASDLPALTGLNPAQLSAASFAQIIAARTQGNNA